VNLTIKNIPEKVCASLKRTASDNHRSLNSEVVRLLEEAAEEAERRRRIVSGRKELEEFV